MRKIFIAILMVSSYSGLGQQWTKVQVDSMMTLILPDNYEVLDSLGQRAITAEVDNGLIFVSVMENKGEFATYIHDEKALLNVYKGFREGVIQSQEGQFIKEEIIEKNGLKCIRFSSRVIVDNEKQIIHSLGIILNKKVYSLNFWELEEKTQEMTDIREKFFGSVILPNNLTLKNQLNSTIENSPASRSSYFIGQIMGMVLTIGLMVSAIIWVTTKATRA